MIQALNENFIPWNCMGIFSFNSNVCVDNRSFNWFPIKYKFCGFCFIFLWCVIFVYWISFWYLKSLFNFLLQAWLACCNTLLYDLYIRYIYKAILQRLTKACLTSLHYRYSWTSDTGVCDITSVLLPDKASLLCKTLHSHNCYTWNLEVNFNFWSWKDVLSADDVECCKRYSEHAC